MTTYEYHVYREGKWWMVEIPAIDGLTQARHLTDVEDIARSYISLDQDVPPSEVQLRRASVKVRGRDVTADAGEVTRLRNSAAELEKQADMLRQQLVAQLVDGGVPIRDIGTVVNVSYQRVQQIAQQGAPVAKANKRAVASPSGTTTRTKTSR